MTKKSKNVLGKGGNLKQGEMHHCLRGDGRPWLTLFPFGNMLGCWRNNRQIRV